MKFCLNRRVTLFDYQEAWNTACGISGLKDEDASNLSILSSLNQSRLKKNRDGHYLDEKINHVLSSNVQMPTCEVSNNDTRC